MKTGKQTREHKTKTVKKFITDEVKAQWNHPELDRQTLTDLIENRLDDMSLDQFHIEYVDNNILSQMTSGYTRHSLNN